MEVTDQDEDLFISAEDWFACGSRVPYDPNHKRICQEKSNNTVNVFVKVERPYHSQSSRRWLTLLPGFPDGSYGYVKVNQRLEQMKHIGVYPRLFVEYAGQGDSDKPKDYTYSTTERADLVEALWRAYKVEKTVVVTFDYSSLVLLELLRRQQDRHNKGATACRIEHVLIVNGGLFADGHTHPATTTPLLQTKIGRIGSRMAQRSNLVLNTMLKPLYSKEYRIRQSRLMRQELRETRKAIRLHKGTSFMSSAAGFVSEHKENSTRWDLHKIFVDYCSEKGITIHVVGSTQDRFEFKQISLARERLGSYYPSVKTETIPGGHRSTMEQADKLAVMIESLLRKEHVDRTSRPWTQIDQPMNTGTWPEEEHTTTRKFPAWASVR